MRGGVCGGGRVTFGVEVIFLKFIFSNRRASGPGGGFYNLTCFFIGKVKIEVRSSCRLTFHFFCRQNTRPPGRPTGPAKLDSGLKSRLAAAPKAKDTARPGRNPGARLARLARPPGPPKVESGLA